MKLHWSERLFVAIDTETTGVDVEKDRIVQLAVTIVDSEGRVYPGSIDEIINPGIDIPTGASDIHGITTERVQKEGVRPVVPLAMAHLILESAFWLQLPIVIYNAPFDWPLLLNEFERHEAAEPNRFIDTAEQIIDPLLLDRHLDKYRRGSRRLEDVARHYNYDLGDGAHDAKFDTLAAAHVARSLVQKYDDLRSMELDEMYDFQRDAYVEWRDGINAYWKSRGIDRRVEGDWPLGAMAMEAAS